MPRPPNECLTNNRNGQGHDQYTRDGAACTDNFAHPRNRTHITIAHRGHGNDSPPKGGGDGGEGGARLLLLSEVAQRRKD